MKFTSPKVFVPALLVVFAASGIPVHAVQGSTQQAEPAPGSSPWESIQSWETGTVTRVVDGDTMLVQDDVTGVESRIRFIGINAPKLTGKTTAGNAGVGKPKQHLKVCHRLAQRCGSHPLTRQVKV